VRCAPPDNKPTAEEAAACLPHLDAEFSALDNARAIVALGRIAFDACLRLYRWRGFSLSPAPKFAHGSSDVLPDGRVLLGCYHPSRQNTHTGRLTAPMMDAVFQEARRVI
jgi:uracil-DNA glycosylase